MDEHLAVSRGPVFEGLYVPYFYSSGKFLSYDMPYKSSETSYFSRARAYDFTSDIVPKRNLYRQPTVEDIIKRGYFAVPESEPETAIISDKQHTSKLGLDDVIGQIRDRYKIYELNMYQIEIGKCYAVSSQMGVESARGGVRTSSREAYSLTKNINEFYQQQCEERRNLWADVSRLKQALPEQAQGYLSSYRKLSTLNDDTTGETL